MTDIHLSAEFDTPATARKMSRKLVQFFERHAAEANESEERVWDLVSDVSKEFGKKHSVRWRDPLAWGDEDHLSDVPEVAVVGRSVVVFHDYCSGFGPDLPRVLKKAGAKVSEKEGPPILLIEWVLPTKGALHKALTKLVAQRDELLSLVDWKRPRWLRHSRHGEASDVHFVVDGSQARLTLPLNPRDVVPLQEHFKKHGATKVKLTLATKKQLNALEKAEDLASAETPTAPAKAAKSPKAKSKRMAAPKAATKTSTKTSKIPTTKPKVVKLIKEGSSFDDDSFNVFDIASTGSALICEIDGKLASSSDGKKFRVKGPEQLEGFDRFLTFNDEIWSCGYAGVLRSKDNGKSWKPGPKLATPRADCRKLRRDESGAVWLIDSSGVSVWRGGKGFESIDGTDPSAEILDIAVGGGEVFVTDDKGHVFRYQNGALRQLKLNARVELACVVITSRGTVLTMGHSHKKGVIFRSEDFGGSWSKIKADAETLLTVAAELPDGRLIAGGYSDVLRYSCDDGKSWKKLKKESKERTRHYNIACRHGESVFLHGWGLPLLKVD